MAAFLLIALAIAVRFGIALHWLPQAFHFTPLGAALLYFGAKQPRKWIWAPVAALLVADLALNRFVYHWPITLEILSSTLYYVLAIALGSEVLKEKVTTLRVLGASLGGSLLFFVISNLFVWADGGMYTLDVHGLITCFVAAVPFFRGTVLGDLVFSAVIFGTPVLLEAWQRKRALAAVRVQS